jgi:hypothetical protein
MTIYGSPGGTPLNQNGGFQGTTPGNAVGATLQVVNPGVGLFPPNSNNLSGDSVLASASRAACPMNANAYNFGVTSSAGAGVGGFGNGGRSVAEALSGGDANGVSPTFTAQGGSAQSSPAGGNGLGAGGYNQTNSPSAGEGTVVPANGPPGQIAVSPAVYRG